MDTSLGISRRTLLRRGAVVGGSLVWTVPVVHTLAAPSAAAGTPLDGISFVAVLLKCGDVHYRMKWEVEGGTLVGPETGSSFDIPGGPQLTDYPNIQSGPAPGTSAGLVGEAVQIGASTDCVLVNYVMKHGPCNVTPSSGGTTATGGAGPWTFNPLASPPTC
jgi:hypothetical protein